MKKPLYILLGILAIFVIIYFLLVQKEKKTFRLEKVENFLQLDSASVNRFQFSLFSTRLAFEKVGQQWYMIEPDSFRADNQTIGQMLSMASHLEVGEIISSNPDKQYTFQVDSLTGNRLDFYDGGNLLASVVIGKLSKDLLQAYLRKTDSDDVYLAQGIFNRIANRKIETWKDRGIFTFDPGQAEEIEFSRDGEKFKLTREDTLWQLSRYPYQETTPADPQAVQEYVEALTNIKADAFATRPEIQAFNLEKPVFELKLRLQDGGKAKFSVVPERTESNRYLGKNDRDKNVFVLFEYTFKRLAKSFEDFQPKQEE
jgi:hypothetical protein